MKLSNTSIILILLLGVLLFLLCRKPRSGYQLLDGAYGSPGDYSTDMNLVGHRPPTQDFLPTVGEVPTGEDGMVVENDAYIPHHNARLCGECLDLCLGWVKNYRNRDATPEERDLCWRNCQLECNLSNGL